VNPWATGPFEILQHGLDLLAKDSDANRRLAMISIDNAVELTIKTYLSLPQRVTGLAMSKKDFTEISESFPKLLDALETHAKTRLEGIDLGEIEWYHRLRNQLYHQGNGLTVERQKVEVYAKLATLLFRNLFGIESTEPHHVPPPAKDSLGEFLELWIEVEKKLQALAARYLPDNKHRASLLSTIMALDARGFIAIETSKELQELRLFRNELVHGTAPPNPGAVLRLFAIYRQLEHMVGHAAAR
jgi:hypothetical protein